MSDTSAISYIAPLAISVASGLAFLAVKHPTIYERLFNALYGLMFLAFLTQMAWNFGVTSSFTAVIPFIHPDKVAVARAASDALTVSSAWIFISPFIVMGYLLFLSWLAHL